jgi:hypothetical protein
VDQAFPGFPRLGFPPAFHFWLRFARVVRRRPQALHRNTRWPLRWLVTYIHRPRGRTRHP